MGAVECVCCQVVGRLEILDGTPTHLYRRRSAVLFLCFAEPHHDRARGSLRHMLRHTLCLLFFVFSSLILFRACDAGDWRHYATFRCFARFFTSSLLVPPAPLTPSEKKGITNNYKKIYNIHIIYKKERKLKKGGNEWGVHYTVHLLKRASMKEKSIVFSLLSFFFFSLFFMFLLFSLSPWSFSHRKITYARAEADSPKPSCTYRYTIAAPLNYLE